MDLFHCCEVRDDFLGVFTQVGVPYTGLPAYICLIQAKTDGWYTLI